MKSIKKLLIILPIFLMIFTMTVSANNVSEIDISAVIADDGSAYIAQTWHGQFSEGTENYIPIMTGFVSVSDFKVSDEKGPYTVSSEWDIGASFDEKSRKCGINETPDGIELCFGISEYGEKTYTIEYVVHDFIKSYTDYDGTNFMFINPHMSTFPTDGYITITLENGLALDENNAGIWAFGYDGMVGFNEGVIEAYTLSELEDDNSMVIMIQLDKGLIHPITSVDDSFESVKQMAFEGSDYDPYYDEEATWFETLIGFSVFILISAAFIFVIASLIKRKKAIKNFFKNANYYRDIPNSGKIEISHYLAQTFDVANEESLIIGALMLSMMNKCFIEPIIEEEVKAFGRVKESVNLKLVKEPVEVIELLLYNLLICAAGADGVLQEKELEKYAYANPDRINNIIDGIKLQGKNDFISKGGYINYPGNCIKHLTESGRQELSEVMGLKKYLEEFSLISERSVNEITIWKDYMVYATLFGIADKVIDQFEKVYPDRIPEFRSYNTNVIIAHSYYRSMHRSAQRAIAQRQRSSGGGGRASFGGGGGFSGGGRGGGSR